MAERLSQLLGHSVDSKNLPLRHVRFASDLQSCQFSIGGRRYRCQLADYTIAVDDAADDDVTGVRSLGRVRRSRNAGPETSIRFVNRRNQPVKLLWVNGNGNRVAYGEIPAGQTREQHTYAGHVWLVMSEAEEPLAVFEATEQFGNAVVDVESRLKIETATERRPWRSRRREQATQSPDGRWRAELRDGNVWLTSLADGQATQLSDDGRPDDSYVPPLYWSPDSRYVALMQVRRATPRQIHLIESSPSDQLQPRLHTLDYNKPGDPIDAPRPRLFDVETKQAVSVDERLFDTPWSCSDLRWWADGQRLTFLYNQRGHQVLRVISVDPPTGNAVPLIDEQSKTFIDYAGKLFVDYLEDSDEILWMSERDGWNHLYLFDAATGQMKHQITRGEWVVRRVERVDVARRCLWFYAGGVDPDQDPYYLHYCRVNFDGSGMCILTPGHGSHEVEESPDGRFLIDRYSRVDMPLVTELRSASDGALICVLERGDSSRLEATGWRAPTPFVAPGRDGSTPIFGVLFFPQSYDPAKKYPVIEQIYAGPQGSFVPKRFAPYYNEQALAELGFVVVQIDGMGTSQRSKAFHDVCWQNLGDSGFPDRIAWMQAAAKQHPELDLSRVGIFGGSAGGQSTVRALTAHPDFYHVGCADCGCHDNRMDKVWWNELWMGWPVGPHFAEQSNITNAHKLEGKLLLIVGELDRNVDPASTMQVVDALIKADKDFDLLVMPGAGHGAAGSAYGTRRQMDFFVRHLLHREPRWATP
ncbi:MAG: prolyl oligopeptidase family serine peptidase [Planctomycetaceae bacterium]|nr:prolyl oligopeptidase family serine peptidase [Planctomycetaceae bacterium]